MSFSNIKQHFDQIFQQQSIKRRFSKALFWTLIGRVIRSVVMMLVAILSARIIGKVDYGKLGIITTTISLFGIVGGAGLSLTNVKYVSEFRNNDVNKCEEIIFSSFAFSLLFGIVAFLLLFLFSDILAFSVFASPDLASLLRIAAISLFFVSLNSAQIGVLTGLEEFKTLARINVFAGVGIFILAFLALLIWRSLPAIVGAYSVVAFLEWVFTHFLLRRKLKIYGMKLKTCNIFKHASILGKYSLPVTLSGFLVIPINWFAQVCLAQSVSGYEQLGLFNAANKWRVMILFVPALANTIFVPLLSNVYSKGVKNCVVKFFWGSFSFNFVFSVMPGLLFIIFSPWIMSQYGLGFKEGWPLLIACVLSAVFQCLQSPISNIFLALGYAWIGLILNLMWGITFVILSYTLSDYGGLGLSLSYCFSYLIHFLWVYGIAYFLILKKLDINICSSSRNVFKEYFGHG
jgi:O-antigen/teichoic acid export membrane protein